MTEYTPGPWQYAFSRWTPAAPINGYAIRDRNGVPVCVSPGTSIPTHEIHSLTPEEYAAQARLIAAAPDLYEAAKAALSVCEDAFTASNLHYEIREEEGGEGYLCVFCECFSPEGDRHTDDCPATEELSWKAAVALRAAIAKAEGAQ